MTPKSTCKFTYFMCSIFNKFFHSHELYKKKYPVRVHCTMYCTCTGIVANTVALNKFLIINLKADGILINF